MLECLPELMQACDDKPGVMHHMLRDELNQGQIQQVRFSFQQKRQNAWVSHFSFWGHHRLNLCGVCTHMQFSWSPHSLRVNYENDEVHALRLENHHMYVLLQGSPQCKGNP